jgi:protein-tyrosine phosphatase
MAEAFLSRRLAAGGVTGVRVHSAGLLESGRAVPDESLEVMGGWGVDLMDFRSRQVTDDMLSASDLVIGMAREHVREVAVNAPNTWPRTFTLREIVRRGEEVGARSPGQPLDEWVAKLHAGRTPATLVGAADTDDIADPMGRSRRAYVEAANQIDELVTRLIELVWGEQG